MTLPVEKQSSVTLFKLFRKETYGSETKGLFPQRSSGSNSFSEFFNMVLHALPSKLSWPTQSILQSYFWYNSFVESMVYTTREIMQFRKYLFLRH